jgi:outer membrane protein assembly factor BamB
MTLIRKGLAIGIVMLFLVSVVPYINGISDVRSEVDSISSYPDDYQNMRNWSVYLTNLSDNDKSNELVYRNDGSTNYAYADFNSGPLDGPMDSPWSMQGHDAVHTCRNSCSTENNSGAEIWLVSGEYHGGIESSGVIDNEGIIYFGSGSSLYAVYPNSTLKWRFPAGGGLWQGTPAIAEDGTIYFPTWSGYGYFYALNPNGTVKWKFTGIGSSISSPTIGVDGTIYIGSDNHNIFALNPDGTEKWRYTTGFLVGASPAIGEDGTIYVGSQDGYLYALYPNGTLRWRYNTGERIRGDASIGVDGTIYVPSFNSYFYALYPNNGTLKWKGYTGDSIAAKGVALAGDGTIYVGTELLRAYYPNGTLKWSYDFHAGMWGTVPAISGDGTIFISGGRYLTAVNPNATEKWRCPINGEYDYSSPCIGADGTVYVGTTWNSRGYLHAIGTGPLHAEAGGPYSGLASHTPIQCSGLVFGGNPPYTYLWDFGDGNTSNEQNPSHLYRNIGTYNITFTVTDNEGNISTDTTMATITYGPPLVRITKPQTAVYFADMKLFPFQFPLVFGKITIEVEVTHPFLPIERVEFYKWDYLQLNDTTPPYIWTWSERIPLRGTHKVGITIFAYTSETYGLDFIEITKFF